MIFQIYLKEKDKKEVTIAIASRKKRGYKPTTNILHGMRNISVSKPVSEEIRDILEAQFSTYENDAEVEQKIGQVQSSLSTDTMINSGKMCQV